MRILTIISALFATTVVAQSDELHITEPSGSIWVLSLSDYEARIKQRFPRKADTLLLVLHAKREDKNTPLRVNYKWCLDIYHPSRAQIFIFEHFIHDLLTQGKVVLRTESRTYTKDQLTEKIKGIYACKTIRTGSKWAYYDKEGKYLGAIAKRPNRRFGRAYSCF